MNSMFPAVDPKISRKTGNGSACKAPLKWCKRCEASQRRRAKKEGILGKSPWKSPMLLCLYNLYSSYWYIKYVYIVHIDILIDIDWYQLIIDVDRFVSMLRKDWKICPGLNPLDGQCWGEDLPKWEEWANTDMLMICLLHPENIN